MLANYFFIDGSALAAQIRQLRREDPSFNDRKLNPLSLIGYYTGALHDLGAREFKRATFYFPVGDETAIEDYLLMPDHKTPGTIRDVHFKFCGQKLKRSKEFNDFVEVTVPAKWQDRFNKSEKGIDIEICCDALKIASRSGIERLFLLTNDDDFIPFCRTIKEFGANISIIHLSGRVNRNVSLLREADSYDVVADAALQTMFLPIPTTPPSLALLPETDAGAALDKPEAAPSDLAVEAPSEATAALDIDDVPEEAG